MSRLAVVVSPLFLVAIVFSLPVLFNRQSVSLNEFDAKPLERLNRESPQVLLMGNSMLYTRIDEKHLRKISGLKVSTLSNPAAFSACWYLWLKNYAVRMEPKPEAVVLFFRDDRLTLPTYSISGRYSSYIRTLMLNEEPEVVELTGIGAPRLAWRRSALVQWFYPLTLDRYDFQRQIYSLSLDVAAGSDSKEAVKDEIDDQFELSELRFDVADDISDDDQHAEEFKPEGTFLPLMLNLARESGIDLVFYRVKRRPQQGDERWQGETIRQYMEELGDYLAAEGATLVDETEDESLGIALYADGDHLAEEHMRSYTESWWRRMQPVLAKRKSE